MEKKKVGACSLIHNTSGVGSLIHNTSGVGGRVGVPGWD